MTSLKTIGIWVAVIGVVFAILWWQGQIAKIRDYCRETWAELDKCAWPTWDELKGSTVVVSLSILVLGLFTVVVDRVLFYVFFNIL